MLYLVMPREGHFEELYHVFAYLKKHMNSEMVFDLSEPEIDLNKFPRQDWSYSVYSSLEEELKEVLPPDTSEPLGNGFTIRCFVDADHAGNLVTQRSRTGFVVLLNKAPVY